MKRDSLKTRLIVGTTVWLIIALAAGGMALSLAFRHSVEVGFEARLDSLLTAVIAALDVPPTGPARMARAIPDPQFDRPYSGWYWQVADGEARLRSRSLWDALLTSDSGTAAELGQSQPATGPRGEALRLVGRALQYPSRPQPIVVSVAAPAAELQREIDAFNRLLVLSLGALVIGLAGAVAVQVGYGLRPLRELAHALEAVRSGRQSRLGGDYPREVEPLVDAMNDVLDHDERLIERARAHVGNLAHGLKTPLSILAIEAQRAAPNQTRIAEQVAAMTKLVDHHLVRAAAAGSPHLPNARTDVGAVAADLRKTLLRIHADRRLSIETRIAAETVVAGERQDVEEMLGNLMDNACKWAASEVVVRGTRVGASIRVEIDDDGPGLTPDQAARVVERGARLDHGEPGSGLGLSITADLATLYGGAVRFGRSDLGGLRVQLDLPAG